MTARKKTPRKKALRKKTSRKKAPRRPAARQSAGQRARKAIEDGLRDLEKRLPSNLRGSVRDLRANLASLWRQIEKSRQDREQRWRRMELQLRRDMGRLLRRLEKMVDPGSRGGSRKKKSARKKASGRKKTARR